MRACSQIKKGILLWGKLLLIAGFIMSCGAVIFACDLNYQSFDPCNDSRIVACANKPCDTGSLTREESGRSVRSS